MNKITIEDLKCIPAKELHELQLTIYNLVKEKLSLAINNAREQLSQRTEEGYKWHYTYNKIFV
ncbi:hypothetical protein [Amedibacillus sp. YH-ame10]